MTKKIKLMQKQIEIMKKIIFKLEERNEELERDNKKLLSLSRECLEHLKTLNLAREEFQKEATKLFFNSIKLYDKNKIYP